jgi:hypothetical protein
VCSHDKIGLSRTTDVSNLLGGEREMRQMPKSSRLCQLGDLCCDPIIWRTYPSRTSAKIPNLEESPTSPKTATPCPYHGNKSTWIPTLCHIYTGCPRLREGVPYGKVYRYNPKHLCPKLNGYGDNIYISIYIKMNVCMYVCPVCAPIPFIRLR